MEDQLVPDSGTLEKGLGIVNKSANITQVNLEASSYPRLFWRDFFGEARDEKDKKVRERGEAKSEAEVSREAFLIIKAGLIEATLIYGRAIGQGGNIDSNKAGNLLPKVAEALKLVEPNLDFKNEEQVEEVVRKLIEKYPYSAVALGVLYSEQKLAALKKVYQFQIVGVEGLEKPKPGITPRVYEAVFDPKTGKITFGEREMTYEELIQTPQGKKQIGWLIFKRQVPISQEEFEKLKQGVLGKEGKAKISIVTKTGNQTETPSPSEKFILEQLDLFADEKEKMPDLSKPEDFSYVFQEFQQVLSLREEIARATGVLENNVQNIFETIPALITLNAETAISRITEENKKQAQRELEEREKTLRTTKEESMRTILGKRKAQLEQEVAELRRKQEEERKRGESQTTIKKVDIITAIRSSGLLGPEEMTSLGIARNSTSLIDPQRAEEDLQQEIERYDIQIAQYGEGKELIDEIKHLREQLIQASRSTQIKNAEGQVVPLSPADEETLKALRYALNDREQRLRGLNEALKNRTAAQKKLEGLQRRLARTITINGQTKTIREWIEEARREEAQTTGPEITPNLETAEKELAEITVLLEYFDEENLAKRAQRKVEVDRLSTVQVSPQQALFDWEAIIPINPKLNEIFGKQQEKAEILKTLYILFGEEFFYPKTADDDERVRLINIFLSQHSDIISSNNLDNINNNLINLRNKMVSGIRVKVYDKNNDKENI